MRLKSLIFIHFTSEQASKIRFCFDTQAIANKVENLVTLCNKLISKEKGTATVRKVLCIAE